MEKMESRSELVAVDDPSSDSPTADWRKFECLRLVARLARWDRPRKCLPLVMGLAKPDWPGLSCRRRRYCLRLQLHSARRLRRASDAAGNITEAILLYVS